MAYIRSQTLTPGQILTPGFQMPRMLPTHLFRPLREQEPTAQGQPPQYAHYYSIARSPLYGAYSFEELRLNDYQHNRGNIVRPSTQSSFDVRRNGLVRARVPLFNLPTPQVERASTNDLIPLGCDFITFRVGEDVTQDFTVHENLVCERSEFVRLALSKDWKEAKDRVITLPADLPEAFELYQRYLYTNKIHSQQVEEDDEDQEYVLLVRAYFLGQRFLDNRFHNAIITVIICKFLYSGSFDLHLHDPIYENTGPDSPLRKLLQDIYVWAGDATWLDEETLGEPLHPEFTKDLSIYQMKMMNGQGPPSPPYLGGFCRYWAS
jgi:hypothetical protein